MKRNINRQFLGIGALALLVAGIAAGLSLYSTSLYGVGLSPDTTRYIRLARDISENGPAFLSEKKATAQPPIYPVVLAALSKLTGATPLTSARRLNIAMAAAIAFTVTVAVSRVTPFVPARIVIGILTCFSVPLTLASSMGWTEPLFILLVSVSLLVVSSPKPTRRTLFLAALFTMAACLTRYAGIVLIPVVSVFILFQWPGPLRRRLKFAATYAIVPSAFLILYTARNFLVSGNICGLWFPSQLGLATNMDIVNDTVLSWFLPWRIHSSKTLMFGLFILSVAVGWSRRDKLAREIRNSCGIVPLNVAFVAAYILFIVCTATVIAYDPVDDRLLSPVYPSLLIVFALVSNPRVLWGRIGSAVALSGLCLLFIAGPLRVVVSDVNHKAEHGAGGYSLRVWQESALIAHFRQGEIPPGRKLFSNADDALYILAGVRAKRSPAERHYNSDAVTGVNARNVFDRYPGLDGALLVWFDNQSRDYLFTPGELGKMCTISEIKTFREGTIYKIASSNNHAKKTR